MTLTMSIMDAVSASVRPRTDPVSPPAVVEPGPALPGDRLARYTRYLTNDAAALNHLPFVWGPS